MKTPQPKFLSPNIGSGRLVHILGNKVIIVLCVVSINSSLYPIVVV